jgi:hypothetical protein
VLLKVDRTMNNQGSAFLLSRTHFSEKNLRNQTHLALLQHKVFDFSIFRILSQVFFMFYHLISSSNPANIVF